MPKDLLETVRSTKYPLDAFLFVQRGLDATVRRLHGEVKQGDEPVSHHVTGQELCMGLRDFAITQYGLMARHVLEHWRILRCEDFGNIVFALVDAGLMHKTDEDSIDNFKGVFDFNEAFSPQLQLSESV